MVGDSVVRKRKAGTAIRACGCSLSVARRISAFLCRQACPSTRLFSGASSQQGCSLSVARQISVCLCRQACPSIRMLDGLIAQKAEAVP